MSFKEDPEEKAGNEVKEERVCEPLKTEEEDTPNESKLENKVNESTKQFSSEKFSTVKDEKEEETDEKKVEKKTSPFLAKQDTSAHSMEEIDKVQIKIEQINYEKNNIKDNILLREKCKLFRMNQTTKKFELRGEGEIFVTEEYESKMYKISMIRDQIKTFGCNHFIDPRSECVEVKSYKNAWLWYSLSDFCNTGRNDSSKQIFIVRFKEEKASKEFKDLYEKGREVNKELIKEVK
ncbi:hypothetical protein H312_00716 [Anncaliia algerae PRA339]|uniref:RanBD1 domain-containing protein n=1 Tax=Anncaliia algerae PRA339 TaxID=1288291 RepID=A0A059F3Y5_9MICR|nr:hypothetical protein H312_00716 [Anncaliia algerae PRA339]